MTTCQVFKPKVSAPSTCLCGVHWNDHPTIARRALFETKDQVRISAVINACMKDNSTPVCSNYTPVSDWVAGSTPAPDCTCGRSRLDHPARQVLAGIRKWREEHNQPISRIPHVKACDIFTGSLKEPGKCLACSRKWIEHSGRNRGLVIEKWLDLHQSWCKCVIMNGDVGCSCMTDEMIQSALDKKGGQTVACKQFKSKAVGQTICSCGEAFYSHSKAAVNGFSQFIAWRSAHMTNKELLDWFQALGKSRQERISALKRLLTDPHFHVVPPAGMVNPNGLTMAAMLDALDNQHNVKSPKDLEKEQSRTASEIIESANTEKLYTCFSCGEELSKVSGSMCQDCTNYMTEHTPKILGPAAKIVQ